MQRMTGRALGLVAWIIICLVPGAIGPVLGIPDEWYAALAKPSWNPPSWVFGPVWTMLYILMGISAWRISMRAPHSMRSLGLFFVQLILNAAWTPIFFGLHQIGWALVDIVLLWFAIVAVILAFSRRDKLAAALLVPYLAWVSFATCLNYTLWRLNG
jgi:benzodiazapine receptor